MLQKSNMKFAYLTMSFTYLESNLNMSFAYPTMSFAYLNTYFLLLTMSFAYLILIVTNPAIINNTAKDKTQSPAFENK